MAWTSGQVNPTGGEEGYDLLLTALRDFLTTNSELVAANQNWVVEKEETVSSYNMSGVSDPTYTADFRDLYLRGPGLAQQDNVHVNLRTYQAAASGVYNWYISGATSFLTGQAWEDQPGNNIQDSYPCMYTLVNSLIDYWFIANGRRFIAVCKIEGDFYMSYNGLMLPYGLPSEYPYPLVVSGTAQQAGDNHTDAANRNLFRITTIGQQYANLRLPSTDWAQLGNADFSGTSIKYAAVWPWFLGLSMAGNLDGSYSLLPAMLITGENGSACLGDLQGIFHVPGIGQTDLSAEDTLTIGSDTYLIVQNVALNTRLDYAAIKLE